MSEPGEFDLFDPAVVANHDDARDMWQELLPPPALRDIDSGLYELRLDLSPVETLARWVFAHRWADEDLEAAWAQRNAEDHLRRLRPAAMADYDQRVAGGGDPFEALRAVVRAPGDLRYFSQSEAQALIGRRYRATGAYSAVPPGSVGLVTGIYAVDRHDQQFGVDVTWQGISGGSPHDTVRGALTDGFSRSDLFLVFTAGPNRGTRAMVPLDMPDGGPLFAEALPAVTAAGVGGTGDEVALSSPPSRPQGPIGPGAGVGDPSDAPAQDPPFQPRWPRRMQGPPDQAAGL